PAGPTDLRLVPRSAGARPVRPGRSTATPAVIPNAGTGARAFVASSGTAHRAGCGALIPIGGGVGLSRIGPTGAGGAIIGIRLSLCSCMPRAAIRAGALLPLVFRAPGRTFLRRTGRRWRPAAAQRQQRRERERGDVADRPTRGTPMAIHPYLTRPCPRCRRQLQITRRDDSP